MLLFVMQQPQPTQLICLMSLIELISFHYQHLFNLPDWLLQALCSFA